MSLTIGKLSEQIRRRLAGGDISKDFPIKDEEMQLMITEKVAQVLRMQLIEGIKYDDNRSVNPHFIGVYEAAIKFDNSKKRYYLDLPETFIEMVGGRGIQNIIPKGGSFDNALVPITTGLSALISGTPAGNLENRLGYYPQGSKVIIYAPNKRTIPKEVILEMVTASDTDIDPAVAGMVMDMILDSYKNRFPQDMMNDENSDLINPEDK